MTTQMLMGGKYGTWTVGKPEHRCGKLYHECTCECGTTKLVLRSHLISGRSTSCGCHSRPNLIGQRFGKLVVVEYAGVRSRGNKKTNNKYERTDRCWLCQCDCGKQIVKSTAILRSGAYTSCGCYLKSKFPRGDAATRLVYKQYSSRAKRLGYAFNIPFDKFVSLTSSNCHYCGSPPVSTSKSYRGNGDYHYNGLDRYDNSGGYTIDNVVPCCIYCNASKSSRTVDEFKKWAAALYNHSIKDSI